MFEIEDWSKDHVYEVMRELLYSFNYMWFVVEEWVKNTPPEELKPDAFLDFAEQFGSYEALRLARVSDPPGGEIDRFIYLLNRSHWAVFEDIEITKVSDTELRMRTLGCTSQKAARRWGMDYYACGQAGLKLREGFFRQINPKARVSRVFTPPDARPEGCPQEMSCEWRITIDQS
ncbi:MAG: hypothetical protein JXI32_03760 [Deltaproteobacteria bacterium]|nr:hypothetical protein [Deltaproteobacteria bacterium]